MKRCCRQEDTENQISLAAIEEAGSRNARMHGVRKGQYLRDSDEEELDCDSEDNCDDAEEPDIELERASTLVTTSCGQREYIDLDDESRGSDSIGILDRMLNPQRV